MDIQILTDDMAVKIISGIIMGILGYFFGKKRADKKNQNKNPGTYNENNLKNIKTQ